MKYVRLKLLAVLCIAAGAMVVGPLQVDAGGPPLIYHGSDAIASFISDQNAITTQVIVSSSDYTYSTGAENKGTYVSVTLTDDNTGQQIDFLDNFVQTSADFAPNFQSAILASTSFDLQSYTFGGTQTITLGAVWTAVGTAQHFTVVSHFCGPPQPCFGLYNQMVTTHSATIALSMNGVVDGVDLGQLVGSSDARMNSRTGVYLAG
jgi:hypothetical protein